MTPSEKESDSKSSFETPIGYKNYSQLVSVSASSKETPPLFTGITDMRQAAALKKMTTLPLSKPKTD